MNSCKSFARKFPLLISALTVVFFLLILRATILIPDGPISAGISEVFMAVCVFIWTALFMGKEKVRFNVDGFGYAFRRFRAYYIFMAVITLLMVIESVYSDGVSSEVPVRLLDALITGATVGIVEEFSFRGLVFGGIVQKIGNNKKNIIIAAVISGLLFGLIHIESDALAGEISDFATIATSVLKTCQAGIFGVIFALVYIKTRNIYAVAALHSLNDFILFVTSAFGDQGGIQYYSYVTGQTNAKIIVYLFFTVILVPILVKCIKDIKEDEVIPFDDDFKPRAVQIEKNK